MKPKYLQAETGGRDRWMISYLDVLTILLIFFVAVAAESLELSRAEAHKTDAVRAAPTAAVAMAPPDPAPVPPRIGETLGEKLEAYGLDWRPDPSGVVITLPQSIVFRPGKSQVNPAALATMGRIADVLRGIPNQIRLAGHTDPVPIHNRRFRNNWELAAARSLALLNILTTRYEIAESRFTVSSYGDSDPRDSNETAEGRASNRRVEILILDAPPGTPPAGK